MYKRLERTSRHLREVGLQIYDPNTPDILLI